MNKLKAIALFLCGIAPIVSFSQAAFDNCASALASPLTMDGGFVCGADVGAASTEAGECLTNWAGLGNQTMWSSFVATNDSIVINYVEAPAGTEYLAVYGPNTGCQPACADEIFGGQQIGDPGHHILLTGLVVGATYLIQIDGGDPGGPSVSPVDFCIGVAEPSDNSMSTGADLVDECGTAFSSTTDGGYWQSGTGTGFANLDANAGTTCGGCIAGNDVSFVINNAAWSTFCSLVAGTWQITVDNVSGCALTGAGIQAAVFTGTTGALVNEGESSPVPAGGWTSPVITVNAGECAFLMIDGFAGDVCNYDVTLTNVSGSCTVLSLNFLGLNGYKNDEGTFLNWTLASEVNNVNFRVERSYDGENFEFSGDVPSIGDHHDNHTYTFEDLMSNGRSDVYYRVSSIDKEGAVTPLGYKHFKRKIDSDQVVRIYPNPVNHSLQVEVGDVKKPETAELLVYSMNGVILKSQKHSLNPGVNILELQLEDLQAGNYYVKVVSESKVYSSSFFKK